MQVEGRSCHVSPSGFGEVRQQLLHQFESTESSLEGLTPFLVGGDLELPPLSLPVEDEQGTHSPRIGVTFPDYLLPIPGSDSTDSDEEDDMADPEWVAKYADFACDSDGENSDWEVDEVDIVDEVGPLEDVLLDNCDFQSRYADGHWDCLETTLVGDRETFLGPQAGPTRRQSR